MTLPNVDTIDSYGGLKKDYGIAVVNSETDRAADDANRAYANIAMATHTLCRAWVQFTSSATTPTIVQHDALWGNTSFVAPTIVRSAQGIFDITWPTSVTPESAEDPININIRIAGGGNALGAVFRHVQCQRQTAVTLRVHTFDTAGALQDFAGTTYNVWWT